MLDSKALRAIMDQYPEAVLIFSTGAKLVDANAYALDLYRRRSKKLVGRKFGEFFAECDRKQLQTRFIQVVRTEETFSGEAEIVDGGDRSRPGRVRLFLVEGTKARLVVAILSDDNLLSQAVAQTEQLRKQLIFSMRLSAVAESYLMLMHSIHPHVQSIEKQGRKILELSDIFGEPGKSLLRAELAVHDRATVAVMRALRTGQSITRHDEATRQSIGVQNLLEDLRDFCKDRCESRGITLEIPYPGEFAAIEANGAALLQALINIVGNAYDSVVNAKVKRISVDTRLENSCVSFCVSDSGAGIAETYRSRLGEPFFSTKAIGQASGLGLYFARRIAESHGGQLQCTRYQSPTTFVLTVPLSGASNAATKPIKSDRAPRSSSRGRTSR